MNDGQAEERLISRLRDRDSAALAQLYDRHAPHMLAVSSEILGNRKDAEDLVHDAFIEIWHRIDDYDPTRSSLRTWLLLRVRSRAIDRMRALQKARARGILPARPVAVPPDSTRDPVLSDEHERAARALVRLSDEQWSVLELAYFRGLTCQQIASHREIPVEAVKSHLVSGLARLRQELDSEERGA